MVQCEAISAEHYSGNKSSLSCATLCLENSSLATTYLLDGAIVRPRRVSCEKTMV